MNNLTNPENEFLLTCRCCNTTVTDEEIFCPECKFPLKGTEAEQGKHIGRYIVGITEEKEAQKSINQGRYILFGAAALHVIAGVVAADKRDDNAIGFVIGVMMGIILAGLGFWSEKNPYAAFLAALIIFFSINILAFVINPASLFSGFIFKIIIVLFLLFGLQGAVTAKNKTTES
ncbi:MAG TPA: hypothetical protein VEC12_03490 [Bacteroidia bacterium]|nr:hypothetical protein [Bacteroidia bacterium]